MLERLRSLLYPMVEQNAVSDAMLYGPDEILGTVDGALDMLANDGRHVDPGTVTIAANLTTLTQVPAVDYVQADGTVVYKPTVDWNTRFRPGDEIILGGSAKGNNLRRVVATVAGNGQSLTVTSPVTAAESGLLYGKTTYALLRRCQELLLYPGGYETDTELRTQVLGQWIQIMQRRGSRGGLVAEMERITNAEVTLLESAPDLDLLGANVAYTQSTISLNGTGWASAVAIGDSLAITSSVSDSNGRYTVYDVTGTTVKIGHRAARSQFYPFFSPNNAVELQLREDRQQNHIAVRLFNSTANPATVGLTLTATGATYIGAFQRGTTGTTTQATTGTLATVTLTAPAYATAEVVLRLSGVTATSTFQLAVTGGTPQRVTLGEMGLCPMTTDTAPNLAALWPWRWGGIVATGLRSRQNETGLAVRFKTKPGWFLEVSTVGHVEEDAYTMASPDEFVVLEVDHRNYTNYTERTLNTLVREVLLPADVDGVLGLL
jgi:hypothetical protein